MRAALFSFALLPLLSPFLFFTLIVSFPLSFSLSLSLFFSSLSRRQWRNLVWWGGLARQNMITTIAVTMLPELTQPEPDHLSQMGPGVRLIQMDTHGDTFCPRYPSAYRRPVPRGNLKQRRLLLV